MSDLRERLAALTYDGDCAALLGPEHLDKLTVFIQAELAALVRKIAEHVPFNFFGSCSCGWRYSEGANGQAVPQWQEHLQSAMLTPPMTSAIEEHNVGIRAECNGEWLNMIARLFGPIPCGGTSLEIAERHLAQVDAKVRAEALSDNKMPCGHLRAELCTIRVGQGPGTGKQYCDGCEREGALKAALAEAQKLAAETKLRTEEMFDKLRASTNKQIAVLQGALRDTAISRHLHRCMNGALPSYSGRPFTDCPDSICAAATTLVELKDESKRDDLSGCCQSGE